MNKKLQKICVLLIGLLLLNISAPIIYAADTETEVEVEVYLNEFDEEYIKNVEFDDGSKVGDYTYTVEYARRTRINTTLGNYFSYAAWIKRDGVVTLSLKPKNTVRYNRTTKNTAWNVLKNKTTGMGGSSNWKNETTLKWQYDCHFDFATFKDYWNLEPHRKASSYAAVVIAKCNP